MFIKLPSGRIFRIDNITSCKWIEHEPGKQILSVTCSGDGVDWHLQDEDAKRLYEYLSSIAIA